MRLAFEKLGVELAGIDQLQLPLAVRWGEEVVVIERKAVAPRGLCFFLYVDIVGIGYAEEVV
jgi:hypothetical protein